jgi:hypothetical protein
MRKSNPMRAADVALKPSPVVTGGGIEAALDGACQAWSGWHLAGLAGVILAACGRRSLRGPAALWRGRGRGSGGMVLVSWTGRAYH